MGSIEYETGIQPNAVGADNIYSKIQGTRDGAPFSADWILARSLEGRVFIANAGSVTTALSFGAGSITETEMDLFISVPSGTTIGILEVAIKMETYGTDAIFECMAKTGTGGTIGAGSSVTPRNVRSDSPFTSLCTVTAAATTTNGVALTGAEFFRDGLSRAKTVTTFGSTYPTINQKFVWNHKDAGYIPIVVGGTGTGCAVYASAQAGTGFITVTYVEVPSTRIT